MRTAYSGMARGLAARDEQAVARFERGLRGLGVQEALRRTRRGETREDEQDAQGRERHGLAMESGRQGLRHGLRAEKIGDEQHGAWREDRAEDAATRRRERAMREGVPELAFHLAVQKMSPAEALKHYNAQGKRQATAVEPIEGGGFRIVNPDGSVAEVDGNTAQQLAQFYTGQGLSGARADGGAAAGRGAGGTGGAAAGKDFDMLKTVNWAAKVLEGEGFPEEQLLWMNKQEQYVPTLFLETVQETALRMMEADGAEKSAANLGVYIRRAAAEVQRQDVELEAERKGRIRAPNAWERRMPWLLGGYSPEQLRAHGEQEGIRKGLLGAGGWSEASRGLAAPVAAAAGGSGAVKASKTEGFGELITGQVKNVAAIRNADLRRAAEEWNRAPEEERVSEDGQTYAAVLRRAGLL